MTLVETTDEEMEVEFRSAIDASLPVISQQRPRHGSRGQPDVSRKRPP
jgi:hypothetical protein